MNEPRTAVRGIQIMSVRVCSWIVLVHATVTIHEGTRKDPRKHTKKGTRNNTKHFGWLVTQRWLY